MSPHAVTPLSPASTSSSASPTSLPNGSSPFEKRKSRLPAPQGDELLDLICVGFGPSSLAVATALDDAVEWRSDSPPKGSEGGLPGVCFLEKQDCFAWHANMQLPGAKMQISWVKDLATFRNPQSRFTFLNYLHCVGRLVSFTNLGTFLPLRKEMERYMQWCADWFPHLVEYSQQVVDVSPDKVQDKPPKAVKSFVVTSKNLKTGAMETRRARHVVISVGSRPTIPAHLPQDHERVIHSANYLEGIEKALPNVSARYHVLVIGAGQSAAEVFRDLHSRYPNCSTRLLIKSEALRPSDDSPFVNQVFDPDRVDAAFLTDPEIRASDIVESRATNYGVVRLELLEQLYSYLYEQKIDNSNEETWKHSILPYRTVSKIEDLACSDRIQVQVENREGLHGRGGSPISHEYMEADAVIIAAGYEKDRHESLLRNVRPLMENGNGRDFRVGRDYRIILPNGHGQNAGIWLQGHNEKTHGLGDSLLSNLATRSGELVDSIFYSEHPE